MFCIFVVLQEEFVAPCAHIWSSLLVFLPVLLKGSIIVENIPTLKTDHLFSRGMLCQVTP